MVPSTQVFEKLINLGPSWEVNGGDPWFIKQLPFRNGDRDEQPHAGLRVSMRHGSISMHAITVSMHESTRLPVV
jgi:hypothetical protein